MNPLIFDLRSRRSKELPHLQSSIFGAEDRRTPHLQSSNFGPEDRRTPHLRSSALKNGSKIGQKMGRGGVRLLRRLGGVLRRWGSSIFQVPGTKNPPIFDHRGRKNEGFPHLPPSQPEDRRTPQLLLLPPPLDQWPPAPLSYPEISSARSSTWKIGPKIEIGSLLVVSWRIDPSASRLARHRYAPPPCRAPPRPDPPVICSGLDSTGFYLRTTAPGSADLTQNPVRKGRPVQDAHNRDLCATRLLAAWLLRPAVLYS